MIFFSSCLLWHVLAWFAELMLAVGMLCFFVAAAAGAAGGAGAVIVLLLVSLEVLYVGQECPTWLPEVTKITPKMIYLDPQTLKIEFLGPFWWPGPSIWSP